MPRLHARINHVLENTVRVFVRLSITNRRQIITGAATAGVGLFQHTEFHQVRDIAQRRVLRALGNCGPLAAGQIAIKAIEQLVQQPDLPIVHRHTRPVLPEPRLGHAAASALG